MGTDIDLSKPTKTVEEPVIPDHSSVEEPVIPDHSSVAEEREGEKPVGEGEEGKPFGTEQPVNSIQPTVEERPPIEKLGVEEGLPKVDQLADGNVKM